MTIRINTKVIFVILFMSTSLVAQTRYDGFKVDLEKAKTEANIAKANFEKVKAEFDKNKTDIELLSQDKTKKKELKQAKKMLEQLSKDYENAKMVFYNLDEKYVRLMLIHHSIKWEHMINTNKNILKLNDKIESYEAPISEKESKLEDMAVKYCYLLDYYHNTRLGAIPSYTALTIAEAHINTGVYNYPPELKELGEAILKTEESISKEKDRTDKIIKNLNDERRNLINSLSIKEVIIPTDFYNLNLAYQEVKINYEEASKSFKDGKIKKKEYLKAKERFDIVDAEMKAKYTYENVMDSMQYVYEMYMEDYKTIPNFKP